MSQFYGTIKNCVIKVWVIVILLSEQIKTASLFVFKHKMLACTIMYSLLSSTLLFKMLRKCCYHFLSLSNYYIFFILVLVSCNFIFRGSNNFFVIFLACNLYMKFLVLCVCFLGFFFIIVMKATPAKCFSCLCRNK